MVKATKQKTIVSQLLVLIKKTSKFVIYNGVSELSTQQMVEIKVKVRLSLMFLAMSEKRHSFSVYILRIQFLHKQVTNALAKKLDL